MIADEGWKITIHGGFAWVFEGDKDNTGIAASVTVGPYSKPKDDHPNMHPHRMVLRVPEAALNTERTTLKVPVVAGHYAYELYGDVTLNSEATGTIERTIHERRPSDWNSFYWVYDADRFRDRSGKTRTKPGQWREQLDARLLLKGGELRVLAPRFPGVYEMTFDGINVKQALATHIEYVPRGWGTPTTEIEFRNGKNLIAVKPRLPDGRPPALDIAAECGCLDEAGLGEIPGFAVTFNLYAGDAPPPKFMPRCTAFVSPQAFMPPGPDCPPRSYSF